MKKYQHYINGEWIDASSKELIPVINPANEEVIGEITCAKDEDVLIDENGDVGRLYKAKTTPHMYVIDGSGMLRYNGAIDNLGMTGALFNTDLSKAKNYVKLAIDALLGGSDVLEKETRPYGCSVKY